MIRKSFCFLDRIGIKKEQAIWRQGIGSWEEFLQRSSIYGISSRSKAAYDRHIAEAGSQLMAENSSYFAGRLPTAEHWRLYDHFREDAVYLDIEVDSVEADGDIVVVGLYDGVDTKTMIHGINLNMQALCDELSRYKMIVTFNGTVFDVPYIRRRYPAVVPSIPHFDLRFALRKLGITGGLKDIEKEFGIERNPHLTGLNGGDALLLWKRYRATGDEDYLNMLVEYNEDDVISLKKLAGIAYDNLKKQTLNSNIITLLAPKDTYL